jgi:F420-non-reducing hydrogenase large subunit
VEFALSTLDLFEEVVLGNQRNVAMIVSDDYTDRTHYMGTVDDRNRVNFYDGTIRVVDPDGKERFRFPATEYRQRIAEHVEPWTYLKFPYLKDVGWKGFVDGPDSGVYVATPLSRLNAADGMATPRAQEHFEKMYETLGSSRENGRYTPVHYRLATHWARLIELLYAAERMLELATDPDLCDPEVRAPIEATPSEGIGCVEAPRGTLFHHYQTDPEGLVTHVNLVVGTTNNHAPIAMSIKKAAQRLIRKGEEIGEDLLNRIEMAVRSYDPCLSCATHTIPGRFVPEVIVRDAGGREIRRIGHDSLG